MKLGIVSILTLGGLLYAAAGSTHHSIDADFTPGAEITITAVVTEFRFINPHPYVKAREVGSDGEGKEWMLLLDDRWEMVEAGFTRSTFQPGDVLVATGRPSRREPDNLYVVIMERQSDGFVYQDDDGEDVDDD